MRSFGSPLLVAALVLAIGAPAVGQTSDPEALYSDVRVHETALRRDIDARKASSATLPLLRRARILIGTYEDIARLFPGSGPGNQALWQGAVLAADAFWEFGEAAEKATALRLFNALTMRSPGSSLSTRIADQTRRLGPALPSLPETMAPRPAPAAAPSTGSSPAPFSATPRATRSALPSSAAAQPASTAARAPVRAATSLPSTASTLTSIRREILPDALRVTLELEREAPFQDERLDGPSRVFIDLRDTRAVDALKEATLAFADDVVRQIRVAREQGSGTRVVLDLDRAGRHSVYALYNPYRVVIDVERLTMEASKDTKPAAPAARTMSSSSGGGTAKGMRSALPAAQASSVSSDAGSAPAKDTRPVRPAARASSAPPELVSRRVPVDSLTAPVIPPTGEVLPTANMAVALANVSPTPPALDNASAPSPPNANSKGGFSLSRQLGLGVARIVIDPGHGGHDPGAQVKGLNEADIVLDVALRLEKLLMKQTGVEVVMVRRSNVFVPLEERTAIANREGADLFLSIHANASGDTRARGVETYFLNFAPNPQAEAIAARENAGSAKTMRSLPDIVKAIALNNKIDESRDFATLVQASMVERLTKVNKDARSLGVKQAPFMVLIGATMPSVLAEISFVTHRQEAALLKTQTYRQQIAEALLNGVMRYQKSLKVNQIATQ